MTHIGIGVSAIRAAQVGLNTTAQNIANAATEGYHRQSVQLAQRHTASTVNRELLGGGVFVSQIARLKNATVATAITTNISGQESASAQFQTLEQIESLLTPGDGSVHTLVTQFFNEVSLLAANPAESVLRQQVTATATQLVESIGGLTVNFDGLGGASQQAIATSVEEVNDLAEEISRANREIRIADALRRNSSQLRDQRDLLINDLAQLVDIAPESVLNGSDPLIAAGGALIIGETTTRLSLAESTDGRLLVNSSTGQTNIQVTSGRLAGLVNAARNIDSGIGFDFALWARTLLKEVDTIHATGIGLNGPAVAINGTRSISDINTPLADANSLYGIESGQLSVTLTAPDGQRTTSIIDIDAEVDSLQDVVNRLNTIPSLGATLSANGSVAVFADAGYGIDFAGRPDQSPQNTVVAGTSAISVHGAFDGETNTTFEAVVIEGGEVGVSENVIVQFTEQGTGRVINTLNFGQGYAANERVEIADGISLSLAPGTLVTADQFSINATATPDTTGLLANLGLGTLFSGNSLDQVTLAPGLTDVDNLAASRLGEPGDSRQLTKLIALRDRPLFTATGETIEERLTALTGLSGTLVAGQRAEIDQRELRSEQLLTERDAVSGVDPNEEFLELLQFQRAFQAASRFVSLIDESLDELLQTIGR